MMDSKENFSASSDGPPTEEQEHILRVYKLLMTDGRLLLYAILQWGSQGDDGSYKAQRVSRNSNSSINSNISMFYASTPKMGGLALRAAFEATMVDASQKFLNGREVSLSLLLGCIKSSCVNIAPLGDKIWFMEDMMQLEYLLTSMQQYMYCLTKLTTLSQSEMLQDIDDLQTLFANGLKAAKIRYNVEDAIINDIADSMYSNINNVKNQSLADYEVNHYQQSLMNEKLTLASVEMYSPKLHEKFQDAKKRLSIFSVTGYDIPHDISTLFTSFIMKSVGDLRTNIAVDIKDLIHLTCKSFIVKMTSHLTSNMHGSTTSLSKASDQRNSLQQSNFTEDNRLTSSNISNKNGKMLFHSVSTDNNPIDQSFRSVELLRFSSYTESRIQSNRNPSCTKCRLARSIEILSKDEEISCLPNRNQNLSNFNMNRNSVPFLNEGFQGVSCFSKQNQSARNSRDTSPKGSIPNSPRNSQIISNHILVPNDKQLLSVSPSIRRKNNRKISAGDRNSGSRPNSGLLCQCYSGDFLYNQSYEETMQIPQNSFGLRQLLLISGPIPDLSSLVSLIMHSWADSNDAINGLNDFDFLFLMEFWNSEIKTFEELLKSHLPHLSRKDTDDSLKSIIGTKMLIITDIYDGINPVSNILFEEIISFSKFVDLTIICTVGDTRVNDFYMSFKSELNSINIVHIEMAESKSDDRNCLLTSIYSHLKVSSKEDMNSLMQYMNRFSKPMKSFFSSSTNLAILAVLWITKSEALKNLQTPTEFLNLIHNTTFKSLIKQLQTDENSKHRSIFDLDPALRDFIKTVGNVALLMRSNNQLFMHEEGKSIIEVSACKYKLSFDQVVSAFFTKKLFWTRRDKKWCFSSTKQQEFLAAIFISLELPIIETAAVETQKRCNLISSMKRRITQTKSQNNIGEGEFGMIEKVLRDLHVNNPEEYDINRYKNVLCHFMGILALQTGDIVSSIAEELVYLLQRTGIETKEDWLDLLSEYSAHKTVIKFIISIFPSKEDIIVTESRVFPYSSLLRYIKPSSVNIFITCDPQNIQSFPALVHEVSLLNCEVQLQLCFPWRNPDDGVAYKFLQAEYRRCTVTEFKGLVCNIETLPAGLEKLKISISKDKNEFTLTSALTSLKQYVPDLWELGLHIKAGSVEPSSLMPLPYIIFTNIYLSGINDTHTEWTCDVIKALLPIDGKYWRINFPGCTLTKVGLAVILDGLSSRGVQLEPAGSIHICSPNIPQMLQHSINSLARDHLRTWCWRYDTDEEICGW